MYKNALLIIPVLSADVDVRGRRVASRMNKTERKKKANVTATCLIPDSGVRQGARESGRKVRCVVEYNEPITAETMVVIRVRCTGIVTSMSA